MAQERRTAPAGRRPRPRFSAAAVAEASRFVYPDRRTAARRRRRWYFAAPTRPDGGMGAKAAVAGAFGLLFASLAGPADAGRIVAYRTDYPAGAVLISQSAKRLYLVVDGETAIAYPVAVARR